jgi:hypothetical protein
MSKVRSNRRAVPDGGISKRWEDHGDACSFYLKLPDGYSEQQLHWQPAAGSWSMAQVIDHLYRSESATFRFVRAFDFSRRNQQLGLGSALRSALTKWALHMPLRFKKPAGLPEPAADDRGEVRPILDAWEKDIAEFGAFLETFPADKCDRFVFRHPLAGRFNLNQTLDFLTAHLLHHRQQIRRIQETRGFPKS